MDGNTNLLLAAEQGDAEAVQGSLQQGVDVNARDGRRQTQNKTALMLAATAGHLGVVQTLLLAGANPHLTDQGPDTQPIPKSLLEHADPDTILGMGYCFGRTALMNAAAGGHTAIAQTLLAAGVDPNTQDAIGYTPLALAVENNHLTTVEALVATGADVNQVVTYKNTPLMLACEKGAVAVGEFLVQQGASVRATNRDRETPLMKAATAGSLPLIRLCLAQGAEVNAISRDQRTALALAAGASRHVQITTNKYGPGRGGREFRQDGSCWEWQPLPEEQLIELVQTLLQAGADPNMAKCAVTPLIEAAGNGHRRLLEVLLEAGAHPNLRDQSGETAASIAKLYGHQEILSVLHQYSDTVLSELENDDAEDENYDEDERWGEDLPQPDFSAAAQQPKYQQAVNALADICGSPPTQLEDVPGGFSIHVNSKRRQGINIEGLQHHFLAQGCFVYEPDNHYGEGPEKLCILPTTDKYDAIAVHQTNGCNYGIGPGYVVEWLRKLAAEQPFILTCIAHDTLAGRFLSPIANPEALADRMYDFCPDIVDQGCGSVELLAESLASSDALFFWWD